jgi:hypothetical protein
MEEALGRSPDQDELRSMIDSARRAAS